VSELDEGWGWPMLSRKAHYFRGAMSLCRRWMYTGTLEAEDGKASKDDCVPCRRAVDRERAS
jgi:hypothetical protein